MPLGRCAVFSIFIKQRIADTESGKSYFSHKIYKITVEIGWVLLASAASGFSGYM